MSGAALCLGCAVLIGLPAAGADVARPVVLPGPASWLGVVDVAVAGDGDLVVLGRTRSAARRDDLLIARLGPTGTDVRWRVQAGGQHQDLPTAVTVATDGRIHAAGFTRSPDLPARGARGGALAGGTDGFVMTFGPDGAVVHTCYLGGSGVDRALGIAAGLAGTVTVVGATASVDFRAAGPLPAIEAGQTDAFVISLGSSGAPAWAIRAGGPGWDEATAVAVDGDGRAHVTGETAGAVVPLGPVDNAFGGGPSDAFVLVAGAGGAWERFAYLGGAAWDGGSDVTIDPVGGTVVIGSTASADFPVAGPARRLHGGNDDAFASVFDAAGRLRWSTLLGGSDLDFARSVVALADGSLWIVGSTVSGNFPVAGAFQPRRGGMEDAFVAHLWSEPDGLCEASYLGGPAAEEAVAAAPAREGTWIGGHAAVEGVGDAVGLGTRGRLWLIPARRSEDGDARAVPTARRGEAAAGLHPALGVVGP